MGLVFIVLDVLKLGMNHDLCVKKSRQHQKGCRIVTICLLSATVKEGGISHQFNEKICSDRVGLYFLPARSKKTVSTINSTKRSAQLGSGSLTACNGQSRRRRPSIQQKDLLSSGRIRLLVTTVKEAASAMGLPNGMFPGTQLYGET